MYCPMKFVECSMEKCAWWCKLGDWEGCAMKLTALELSNIHDRIIEITNKYCSRI